MTIEECVCGGGMTPPSQLRRDPGLDCQYTITARVLDLKLRRRESYVPHAIMSAETAEHTTLGRVDGPRASKYIRQRPSPSWVTVGTRHRREQYSSDLRWNEGDRGA